MLAALTRVPEIRLSSAEARDIATAISRVSQYYSLPFMKPEHVALCALLGTMGRVYGPKVRAVAAKRAKAAAKPSSSNGATAGTGMGTPAPDTVAGLSPTGPGAWLPPLN